MVIWHICSTSGDPCNGMVTVIPGHVKAQANYAKIALINLEEYRFEFTEDVASYAINKMHKTKYREIIDEIGEPDLVVFHGIYLPRIWYFYLKYVKQRYKYIVIPHGSMSRVAQSKSKIKKTLFNKVFVYGFTRKSLAVQFLSIAELNEAEKEFYENKIIIGNGIEKKNIRNNYNNNPIKMTYIGRIDNYHKGLDLLVQACAQKKEFLKKNGIEVNIHGNNCGNSKENLIVLIKQNELEDVVRLHGPVLGKEKERILVNNTSFFIMPSRYEGQPMAALEALSYGIPVIVSLNTGFAEEVQKYGCGLYAQVSVDSIANVIEEACLSISGHKGMCMKALDCVENYYWDKIGLETYSLYCDLVKGKEIDKNTREK